MFTTDGDTVMNMQPVYIDDSSVHGKGLFAQDKLQKGFTLGYLDGQVVDWSLVKQYSPKMEWNALTQDTLLIRPFRTCYGFINHSRKPNAEIRYNPMRVVVLKQINIGDEILLDYRKEPLPKEYIDMKGHLYL